MAGLMLVADAHPDTHTPSAHTPATSVDLLFLETGVPVAGLHLPGPMSHSPAGGPGLPGDSQSTHPDL